jgi:hypothetical protein
LNRCGYTVIVMSEEKDRVLLELIYNELVGIDELNADDDGYCNDALLKVINAFKVATAEVKSFTGTGDDRGRYFVEMHYLVASALWAISQKYPISETAPYCAGGHLFVIFAKALMAMEAVAKFDEDMDVALAWECGVYNVDFSKIPVRPSGGEVAS